MSPKSNIYVSVTRAKKGEGETYHRPQHSWMLSVEQHHFHIPATPHKDPEPVHYAAQKVDGVYNINTHPATSEPAIIGNILIAENASTSPEEIHKLLEEELGSVSKRSVEDHRDSDAGDAEHWIQVVLKGMQGKKIIDAFPIEEFMTFAHGYEASRMDGEGHALLAYPKLHKDSEKKSSKHKFWISHPMADRTRKNDRGEASIYGGLM
jgi:hypothetical protein